MKSCPSCSKPLSPSASFCPFCGARFPAEGRPSIRRPPSSGAGPAGGAQRAPTPSAAPAPAPAQPEAPAPAATRRATAPVPSLDEPEGDGKTTVRPMTPEMLAQLAALRSQHAPRPTAPRPVRPTAVVAPPSEAVNRPVAADLAPVELQEPEEPEEPEEADPVEDEAATRMMDVLVDPNEVPLAADADPSPRMLDVSHPAPASLSGSARQLDVAQAPARAAHPEPAPAPEPRVAAPVGDTPDEAALPGLPRLHVSLEDAEAGQAPKSPLHLMGYAFRHLKAMGVVRLAEHTLERRGVFVEEEKGRTLEEIGLGLWRAGTRVRGHDDAYSTLDSLKGRRAELEAAVREQEGAVAQEKLVLRSELDEIAQQVADSDQALSTLVANLRAVDTELAAARRDQVAHKRGADAAKKELTTLKGGKGAADPGRVAALEADVARHTDAVAPLDGLVATLQKRRAELAAAEQTVRDKVTPLRQQEARLRARIATKDREVIARTQATREQLAGVEKEMGGSARRIGESADGNRAAFAAYGAQFYKLDVIEQVAAYDQRLLRAFADGRALLDDAQAKKGWIFVGAAAAGVVILLVVLSLIF